eukprot:TRINITY_DN19099_c0_g1_i1.p1 TRINITY_DN19099_c0_g1~~TRINITY_DN19099_c0_g1_i1.p1  ORF type:complete len:396 (-),score=73.94 TRINITY_DN19099_c0_g1_i1:95-1195(-)
MADYKVKPEEAPGLTFKKPVKCNPPLSALDAKYVQRKQEVGSKFFKCKSGRQFSYFTDGAKDPSQDSVAVVLCLHGAACSKQSWLLPEPLENIFLISPDRFGHGFSSSTPKVYSFSDACPELLELVDAVYADMGIPKEKKFYIVGHSMGAALAIEMAACPEIRDRIEAIAPISAPFPYWHPTLTKQERKKIKQAPGFLKGVGKKGCCGAINRCMFNALFGTMMVCKDKTGDTGMAAKYNMLKSHTGGDERGNGAMDADPFFVSQVVDGYRLFNSKQDCMAEWSRCWGHDWSYDPADVKAPCFIYNGEDETVERPNAEWHHREIKGSQLTLFPGHSHQTIAMEAKRIIEALVKKERVEKAIFAAAEA